MNSSTVTEIFDAPLVLDQHVMALLPMMGKAFSDEYDDCLMSGVVPGSGSTVLVHFLMYGTENFRCMMYRGWILGWLRAKGLNRAGE